MNPLRFLLGVVALLVLCGASRGAEFKRMPVGPAEPEGNVEQSVPEFGNPAATTGAPLTRGISEAGRGWIQVPVTGPKDRNEATKNKDLPGRKDDGQRSFPRMRKLFGRFRNQG